MQTKPPLAAMEPLPPASANAPLSPALPCANCGAVLTGPFCARCGQHIADYHRSIWRLVGDFFDTVFSWDSKVLRTLGPLFRQPGFLTNEFMAGRRVRYVQPFKLFLFTSAVCLTLMHLGSEERDKTAPPRPHNKHGKAAAASVTPAATAEPKPDAPSVSPAPSPDTPPPTADAIKATIHEVFKDAKPDDKKARAAAEMAERIGDAVAKHIDDRGGVQNSIREVAENFWPRLSWLGLAMLPIFAFMLRALYWRKDSFYFQHLIFSLHYHTFLSIFWTAYFWLSMILGGTFLGFVAVLLLLAPPGYLFLALRRVYGGSTHRTWTKTLLLGGMHLLAIFAGLCVVGATALFAAMR